MTKRILSILETAYRATLEEQDDTVVWLARAMTAAGAQLTVVLRGGAVSYAARGQNASGLVLGDRRQAQPPRVDRELTSLAQSGVDVLAVEEDVALRGLEGDDLIEGVRLIPYRTLAQLCAAHDQVWHW